MIHSKKSCIKITTRLLKICRRCSCAQIYMETSLFFPNYNTSLRRMELVYIEGWKPSASWLSWNLRSQCMDFLLWMRIVPLLCCSPLCLSVVLSNPVMISEKSHRCWVFFKCACSMMWAPRAKCHLVIWPKKNGRYFCCKFCDFWWRDEVAL